MIIYIYIYIYINWNQMVYKNASVAILGMRDTAV